METELWNVATVAHKERGHGEWGTVYRELGIKVM